MHSEPRQSLMPTSVQTRKEREKQPTLLSNNPGTGSPQALSSALSSATPAAPPPTAQACVRAMESSVAAPAATAESATAPPPTSPPPADSILEAQQNHVGVNEAGVHLLTDILERALGSLVRSPNPAAAGGTLFRARRLEGCAAARRGVGHARARARTPDLRSLF